MGSPEKKIHKEGKNWQIKLMRKGRIMRDEKKKKRGKHWKRNNREGRIGKQAKAVSGNSVSVSVRISKQASKHKARKQHKFWIKWSRKNKKHQETDRVYRKKREDEYYQGLEAFQWWEKRHISLLLAENKYISFIVLFSCLMAKALFFSRTKQNTQCLSSNTVYECQDDRDSPSTTSYRHSSSVSLGVLGRVALEWRWAFFRVMGHNDRLKGEPWSKQLRLDSEPRRPVQF